MFKTLQNEPSYFGIYYLSIYHNKLIMRILFYCTIFWLTAFTLSAQPPQANDIKGTWISNLGKGKVEIKTDSSGNYFEGRIIWLKTPKYPDGTDKVDKNNPDRNKRNAPLIGLLVLKHLTFVNDHWEGGTIYDPETGKTYSCKARINGNNLELRGYIGLSEIGRTQTWQREK